MFKITATSKHGGIWNGGRVVKVIETDDAKAAEAMRAKGYAVEETVSSLDIMTISQLKKFARDRDINLGDATQKDSILEIIKAAEA